MLRATDGGSCPMCTFEDGDWYTEDDSKMGTLVKCDHVIPDGYDDMLAITIAEREEELRLLKRKRFLISEAKKKYRGR